MSLQEVEGADAPDLKKALETSIDKVMPTVSRKEKELGMCTDGGCN